MEDIKKEVSKGADCDKPEVLVILKKFILDMQTIFVGETQKVTEISDEDLLKMLKEVSNDKNIQTISPTKPRGVSS